MKQPNNQNQAPIFWGLSIYPKLTKNIFYYKMIPGSKSHVFHACMKIHDLATRQNMRKKPEQGGIRMFLGLREHKVRSNPWYHRKEKRK